MKVVILCGGRGTRLAEETDIKPKPMVQIGDKPIVCHIMEHYSKFGFNEFILALGYKGDIIKDYFLNFKARSSDFLININDGSVEYLRERYAQWKIHLIDTGLDSMTGGRLKRLEKYLEKEENFCLTYGDGVSNVDVKMEMKFHLEHKKVGTVLAVRPPSRFGEVKIDEKTLKVTQFLEKPQTELGRINGGFFIFTPEIFSYLDDDQSILERKPLEKLSRKGELMAYKHDGFWQCMDTLRDKQYLEELWQMNDFPN